MLVGQLTEVLVYKLNSKKGEAMYVRRNFEAHSSNDFCKGKISITYSECVFVVLGMQHSMRMRHIVICGVPGSTIFFHIIS